MSSAQAADASEIEADSIRPPQSVCPRKAVVTKEWVRDNLFQRWQAR